MLHSFFWKFCNCNSGVLVVVVLGGCFNGENRTTPAADQLHSESKVIFHLCHRGWFIPVRLCIFLLTHISISFSFHLALWNQFLKLYGINFHKNLIQLQSSCHQQMVYNISMIQQQQNKFNALNVAGSVKCSKFSEIRKKNIRISSTPLGVFFFKWVNEILNLLVWLIFINVKGWHRYSQ